MVGRNWVSDFVFIAARERFKEYRWWRGRNWGKSLWNYSRMCKHFIIHFTVPAEKFICFMNYWSIVNLANKVKGVEMIDAASTEKEVVIDQYPLFVEFCSLKPQLLWKEKMHQRQYTLEICHTVWNGQICMYYFSPSCLSVIFLYYFNDFKIVQGKSFQRLWRSCWCSTPYRSRGEVYRFWTYWVCNSRSITKSKLCDLV